MFGKVEKNFFNPQWQRKELLALQILSFNFVKSFLHRNDFLGKVCIGASKSVAAVKIALKSAVKCRNYTVRARRYFAGADALKRTANGLLYAQLNFIEKTITNGSARHSYRNLNDFNIFGTSVNIGLLKGVGGIALGGGYKSGSQLHSRGT